MRTAMRTFGLRVYTLRSPETLDSCRVQICPRHLSSFPLFGVKASGFWTARDAFAPRLFVPASFAAGEEPGEVVRGYRQSNEFAEDVRNFDVSAIVSVESTILVPSTSSPLQ